MFGGLSALFSGLALAGLVYTVYLQVREVADARHNHSESLQLLQQQIVALREDLDLQRQRDRIERGPFFRLTENSTDNQGLHLAIENVGAPVLIQDFSATSAGCGITSWYPATWSTNETLKATCQLGQNRQCTFRLEVRDRAGDLRRFTLHMDLAKSPVKLDFSENP